MMLRKQVFIVAVKRSLQRVNKKETTRRNAEGRLGCQSRACGAAPTSVSSSRVAFLSVQAVENMTVKTSETRHPENTQ